MKDYYGFNVPERDPNPPVRYYKIGVCPRCGDEEIGQVTIRSHFERIETWNDEQPWKTSEEDCDFIDFDSPRYYCCVCDKRFDQPHFVEVEG